VTLGRCEAELGACLWHDTNAAALDFLAALRPDYTGLRVLDLGAGAGVCGLALALDGADATLTELDALVPLLQFNVAHNGFDSATSVVPGGENSAKAPRAKPRKGRRRGATRRRGGDSDEEALEGNEAPPEAAEDAEIGVATEKRLSAKERREARAAMRRSKAEAGGAIADGVGGTEEAAGAAPALERGLCRAQPADWLQEARAPTLPVGNFDLAIVCDCLYENKESWDALEIVLKHVLAPGAELVLASATLRRPFLEEFTSRCKAAGYTSVAQEVSEHAVVLALRAACEEA